MELNEIETLAFKDCASGDDALAIVRAGKGYLALCLSMSKNGDVEVVMTSTELKQLVDALHKGMAIVG